VRRLIPLLGLCAACATEPPAAPPEESTGGTGGGGGSGACVDHRPGSSCAFEGQDEACGEEQLCGLAARRCGGGEACCTLGTTCVARGEGRPGGALCDDDSACASGACLPVSGRGVCFRACDATTGEGCPFGQYCALVPLDGGALAAACLGGSAAAPEPSATVCRVDRECAEGQVCRIRGMTSLGTPGAPVGLCGAPTGGEATELGTRCDPPAGAPASAAEDPAAFSAAYPAYGACAPACDFSSGDLCRCSGEQLQAGTCRSMRCTRPCRGDPDCPNRYLCSQPEALAKGYNDRDEAFRICAIPGGPQPETGCVDEGDCCEAGVFRGHGGPCCNWNEREGACFDQEIPEARTHCGVRPDPSLPGRFHTVCRRPDGAGPGEACAADADCTSGLCAAGPTGKHCTSPCERATDRCSALLPGTQCCPTPFGDGLCVEACRADCPAEDACTLD